MKKDEALHLAFQTLSEIAIIGQLANAALRAVLPETLSIAGFGVLNHFVRREPDGESPAHLARAFQVTKGAMTYTLQKLEERNYVKITPDPADGRGKVVRITAAGRKARDAAAALVNPGMRALLERIQPSDFAAALPFLVRLRQTMDAARD